MIVLAMATYLPTDLLPTPPRDLVRDARTPTTHLWACAVMEGRYATAELMRTYLPEVDNARVKTSAASCGTRIPTTISGEIL